MVFDKNLRYGTNMALGDLNEDGKKELVVSLGGPKALYTSNVKLNVPQIHQEQSLSCEAAIPRMALAYKGVNASEEQLINLIGFDTTPKRGNVWVIPSLTMLEKLMVGK